MNQSCHLTQESALSNDIIKLSGGLLELDKPFKLFDMKKFQQNVNRELKRQYPDRRKLESQCISLVSFGTSSSDILDCPIWVSRSIRREKIVAYQQSLTTFQRC